MPDMSEFKTTEIKGSGGPGTTRLVRGDNNQAVVINKPFEIPVDIVYKRHHHKDKDYNNLNPSSSSPGELLGWTVGLDCWTFSTKVEIKICRNPRRLEVWVDGQRVASSTKERGQWNIPITEAPDLPGDILEAWFAGEEVTKTQGWATRLGNQHEVLKRATARKSQPKIEPTDPHCSDCWKLDEGDLVEQKGKSYCMICLIKRKDDLFS